MNLNFELQVKNLNFVTKKILFTLYEDFPEMLFRGVRFNRCSVSFVEAIP